MTMRKSIKICYMSCDVICLAMLCLAMLYVLRCYVLRCYMSISKHKPQKTKKQKQKKESGENNMYCSLVFPFLHCIFCHSFL
jgi:hypothetical protein